MIDKKAIRQRMLELLCDKFPKTFFPPNKSPKPLDLNVFNSVLDALKLKSDEFKGELKIFLAWYTNKQPYLHAVIAEKSRRVNLSGEEVAHVSDFHRSQAKAKLEEEIKREEAMKIHRVKQEQQARERVNEELKNAFDKDDATKKAIVDSIVPNTSKPKLTLKSYEK